MPLPPEQRIQFFVYVIESPSAVDIYHRRGEGDIIQQAVQLNLIPSVVKTAITAQAFEASIKIGLTESMAQYTGRIPLLHISAHGYSDGIQLSSGEILTWQQLKDLLRPINSALNDSLVVCMSSCEGYSGTRMAMHPEDSDLPFLALVGNSEKPTWAETAVAYTTFYHQLSIGEHISVAVEAMKVASGNQMFFLQHAEESRKVYLDYLQQVNTEQAQVELEQRLNDESPENLSGMRKLV